MKQDYANYILQENRKNYNLIARNFSGTREYPREEIRFLFERYLKPNDRILDLGCGNGRYYPFCRDKKARYTGIDNSQELIKEAKRKHPEAQFITADAFSLPFAESYFDAVFSIAVFHHIPSKKLRLKFLCEAKRVLKLNGFLVLTVWKPYKQKGSALLFKYTILKLIGGSRLDFGDVFESWGKNKIPLYRRHFSKRELLRSVKETGLKIEESGLIKNKKGNLQNIYLVARKINH